MELQGQEAEALVGVEAEGVFDEVLESSTQGGYSVHVPETLPVASRYEVVEAVHHICFGERRLSCD